MLSHAAAAASRACAPPSGVACASPVSRPSAARHAASRLPHPPSSSPFPAQLRSRASLTTARNAKGDGPVGAWLDLAALVSSSSKAPGMSEFATEIGRDIYVDIAGWHLYLRDLKMEAGLANAIATQAARGGGKISEADVSQVLKKVAMKLGGGRTTVSVYDVMPPRCVQDLVELAERFAKDL